jgi:hypothetical protein
MLADVLGPPEGPDDTGADAVVLAAAGQCVLLQVLRRIASLSPKVGADRVDRFLYLSARHLSSCSLLAASLL